jgi:hypothetical protein
MFRNLPFCESGTSPNALPNQGFANLGINRSKIFLKQTQIARIGAPMDHAMTVGAQHRKVGRHVISDRHPLL